MASKRTQRYVCYELARVLVDNFINDVLAGKPCTIDVNVFDVYFARLREYASDIFLDEKTNILLGAIDTKKSVLSLLPLVCVARKS